MSINCLFESPRSTCASGMSGKQTIIPLAEPSVNRICLNYLSTSDFEIDRHESDYACVQFFDANDQLQRGCGRSASLASSSGSLRRVGSGPRFREEIARP